MIDNLKTQVAYEEIKIKPAFHRHIIGKNGANSMFVSFIINCTIQKCGLYETSFSEFFKS